jgi:hypothetical protein
VTLALSLCLIPALSVGFGSKTNAQANSASLSEAEQQTAMRRNEICTSANPVGVGLLGEYFSGSLAESSLTTSRIDPVIDFDRTLDLPPGAKGIAPVKSIRWRGWVKAPLSGPYMFHLSEDVGRIELSRAIVNPGDRAGGPVKVDLVAGRFYPIVIEVPLASQIKQALRLEWTAPHGARYLIPRALLHTPTETAKPNPQATTTARR